MPIELREIRKDFVAEIDGIDLSGAIDKALSNQLRQATKKFAVIIIRNQDIDYESFVRCADVIGKAGRCQDITNLNEDGTIRAPSSFEARQARGNALWHTDMPVLEIPPVGAMLLAQELPSAGGETQLADLCAAWSTLPADLKRRIENLTAVHDIETIRRRMGITDLEELKSEYLPAEHPLVCYDPLSGKASLLFGAHTSHITNLPGDESRSLLDELLRHSTREELTYRHSWHRFDLLYWNNRRTLHRVLPYNEVSDRRRLWRVEVLGTDRPSNKPRSFWQRLASI